MKQIVNDRSQRSEACNRAWQLTVEQLSTTSKTLYHTLLTSPSTHGEVRDKRYPTIFTLSANKVSRFCEEKKKQ